jgi:transposase InsO family protein
LEAFEKIQHFKKQVETQTHKKIKILQLDNGGEYKSNNFHIFCQDHGITRQFTSPYGPQQNGVTERKNKTLVGVVPTMFLHSNLPKSYWGETLNTTNDLQNKSPTKALNNKTPFEIWYGILKPTLTHLKFFGYKAFTLIPTNNRQKLDPHFIECIVLGYSEKSKTY